jgi:arylsulfatase A-like enzyme
VPNRPPPLLHLLLAGLALAGAALLGCGGEPPRLNLVVVLVDTLRADHLGYAGHTRPASPRIDALAEESFVFLGHHANASRTGPSVATLFTGLHPRSHGVLNPLTSWDAKGTLDPSQTTLAERLAEHGYRSYGFTGNLNASPRFGFDQGFVEYRFVECESAADFNALALEALADVSEPFYLLLHYMEPHSTYAAPERYRSLWADPSYSGPLTGDHAQLDEIVAGKLDVTAADVERLRVLYDQEIRYLDDRLGELLDGLEAAGHADDTLLVLHSDHGEEFLEHGSALHGYTLYDEQLRVPLLIRDPRRPAGRRIEFVTRQVDVLPTLLELLGIEAEPGLQGRSLVPLFEGVPAEPAPPVFAEASLRAVKTVKLRSISWDGWKLIENRLPHPSLELYHLENDPGEQENLAAAEPERAEAMRAQLRAFAESLPEGKPGRVQHRAEEAARLRELGYHE